MALVIHCDVYVSVVKASVKGRVEIQRVKNTISLHKVDI